MLKTVQSHPFQNRGYHEDKSTCWKGVAELKPLYAVGEPVSQSGHQEISMEILEKEN